METIKSFIKKEISGWTKFEIFWLFTISTIITGLSIYFQDGVLGIISSLTGIICVVCTGKGKLSAYIFGLINTALYAYIAYQAQYYGEVMLNALYYVPMQFVGFYLWDKHMNSESNEVIKTKMNFKGQLITLILSIISIYIYGLFLQKLGGNLPFVDSASTCLSVIAMILSVKRYMEQWLLWIVIDVITIIMWCIDFMNGGSDMATLLMWCVYLGNAIVMFIKWYKESKNTTKGSVK